MKNSSKILIALVAVTVGGAVYYASNVRAQTDPLLKSSVTGDITTIPDGAPTTNETIQSILIQVNDLDKITLNTHIFEDPEFLNLKDSSKDLPQPSDVGRPNPFAPIGVDIGEVPGDNSMPQNLADMVPDTNFASTQNLATTKEVQNIGNHSATFVGSTTVTGTTTRWFEYGINPSVVNKLTKQTGSDSTFTGTAGNLKANTLYFVRSAVENNGVISYGSIVQFRTAQ